MKVFERNGPVSFSSVHDYLYHYIPEDNWVKVDKDAELFPWMEEDNPKGNVQMKFDLEKGEEKKDG